MRRLAREHGVDGIVVSNHGGRALETGRGTIEALGEVVDAVNGQIPVFVDGGFRRGTDVFKALALGARAVGIGRPYVWALSAFGQQGVERVLDILRAELQLTMRQCGTPSIKHITRQFVPGVPEDVRNQASGLRIQGRSRDQPFCLAQPLSPDSWGLHRSYCPCYANLSDCRSRDRVGCIPAPRRRCADVLQGRSADPAEELSVVPPARRGGADVAAHLRADATLGEGHQDGGRRQDRCRRGSPILTFGHFANSAG